MDGNSATDWKDNSCTYTHARDNAWWSVDLGKVEHVTEVYIVNRNKVGERLSDFEIRVGRLLFLTSPVTLIYIYTYTFNKVQIVGLMSLLSDSLSLPLIKENYYSDQWLIHVVYFYFTQ